MNLPGGFLVVVDDLLDDGDRARFHFFENASKVFTDEAENDQLNASNEQYCHQQCTEAAGLVRMEEIIDDIEYERRQQREHAQNRRGEDPLQRLVGEGKNRFSRQGKALEKALLRGSAPESFCPEKTHAGLVKSDPGAQTAGEAVLFGQSVHLIDNSSIHERKIPGITRYLERHHFAENDVKPSVEKLENAAQAVFALDPHPVDDLIALEPFGNELFHQFRRVLKIAVHDDYRVPVCLHQTAGESVFAPEIPGVQDDGQFVILGGEFAQDLLAAIRAGVIDIYNFVIGRDLFQNFRRPPVQLADAAFILIVHDHN